MADADLSPVPGHLKTAGPDAGTFCSREGSMQPRGQCPDGCDHAEHYANDGHPECEDTSGEPKMSLADLERRAVNSSLTDPSWRTDYRS